MKKSELLKRQTQYFEDVNKWFIDELAKWSKKHNMHMQDYTILKIWVIGADDVYEPYSRLGGDEDMVKQFNDALKHYEKLVDDLDELGIRCWQGLEYSEDRKFLH